MMAIQSMTMYQQPQQINLNFALSSFNKRRAFLEFEMSDMDKTNYLHSIIGTVSALEIHLCEVFMKE